MPQVKERQTYAEEHKVVLTLERETKGAVRYEEVKNDPDEDGVFNTLYIRKTAFKKLGRIPETILVTIHVEK